jgi:phage/plasmid-like protein (TIGR03299 family)
MMYVGEAPWHRLGKKLDNPATAEEAIVAAGLDYEVGLCDLLTPAGQQVRHRKGVVRCDTGAVLGVVGKGYVPIQNRESFGFLDSLVTEGEVRYHTAGSLGQGERIWLLAKLPNEIRVKQSDDVTDPYLLLSNSHDGSSSLRVFFTPIRVVCQNTLNAAEGRGSGQGISIVHKGDLQAKVEEARQVLGLAHRYFTDFAEKAETLAHQYPSASELEAYFHRLYPDPLESESSRAANIRQELTRLFEEGLGQQIPEIRHSMWAAFHAVTEYVDHHRPTRSGSAEDRWQRRLQSAWFGTGALLKRHALAEALAI